jgi:hypothetical protein
VDFYRRHLPSAAANAWDQLFANVASGPHAVALGRLDTVACQRVKWVGSYLYLCQTATNIDCDRAVMSAMVKRSPSDLMLYLFKFDDQRHHRGGVAP